MENDQKIKVALVRGNSLNNWEGSAWNKLPETEVTAFCTKKNLYSTDSLHFPIVRLMSSASNRWWHGATQVAGFGQQHMYGLETHLKGFSIVHTAEIYYGYTRQAVRAKKNNSDLKVVTTVWDNSPLRFAGEIRPASFVPARWWKKRWRRFMEDSINGVDLFLPVSMRSAELLQSVGVSEKKIAILTPAVSIGVKEVNDERVKKIVSDPRPFFLAVNRLVPEKGIRMMVEAWFELAQKDKGIRLVLVGEGEEKSWIQQFAANQHISDRLIVVGHLPNAVLGSLYRQAQALVLASIATPVWQEQFGFVLAEALLSSCPVVASASGSIPDVVEDAGLLFTPGDITGLVAAMRSVIEPTVRSVLLNNGQRVRQKFSLPHFQQRLVQIYRSLLV